MTADLTIQTAQDTALTATDYIPDKNPTLVYLAGLSDSSRRVMRAALDTIAGMVQPGTDALCFPWHGLRFQHVQAIRARLAERYAPSTANRHLSALRGAMRAAWKLGYMDSGTYHRSTDVQPVKGERTPAGRDIAAGEVHALMAVCANDESAAGPRDAAIIGLGVTCGLRRAEVAALELADYDSDAGRLVILGKGNKERTVYAAHGTADALADWLALRGDAPGALFHPVNKGGRIVRRPITDQAIYNMTTKRAEEAGVKDFSPHDLRRTFVGDMLDAGADLATVQKIAGHADPSTTARYDRRGERAMQDAAARLHLPYRRRLV
jgi:integrase